MRRYTEASRAQKVEQHLLMFEVIFDEWRKRGLLGLCSGEMVAWCLDLTLFDLVRLPSRRQMRARYACRVCCATSTEENGTRFRPRGRSGVRRSPWRRAQSRGSR